MGTGLIKRYLVCLVLVGSLAAPVQAAFHSGGVGSCGGCHISHGSGGSVSAALLASDPGSVCLNCHAGPGGSGAPSVFSFDGSALTPGGDFYWITRTFTWSGGSSPAARHGHNIVARDFGLGPDPDKARSPGGSFPSAQFSCVSCHDPHGRSGGGTRAGAPAVSVSGSYGDAPAAGSGSGNYRLLGGRDYAVGGFSFINPAPIARQNPALPFAESDDSHVDYGSRMSEWCGNCHNALLGSDHKAGGIKFQHPVNETLPAVIINQYNSYLSTGNLGGSSATAYLQFVPFERGAASPELLDPVSTSGPSGNAGISCLSCHRAHASAFRAAARWDFDAVLLVDSHPAPGDSGAAANDVANSYYGRNIAAEFGLEQGPFCEKCHAGGPP